MKKNVNFGYKNYHFSNEKCQIKVVICYNTNREN